MGQRSERASIAVFAVLAAGLLPAGEAWYRAVAMPALSVQARCAMPLFIKARGTDDHGGPTRDELTGTSLQRAAAAMTVLLGARK
ncbi:MAG: hypothetical protein C0504_11200 [Candidatus Solibacter sp.]|nr:hypothetical protein [Candidatus Solibacter sp.]